MKQEFAFLGGRSRALTMRIGGVVLVIVGQSRDESPVQADSENDCDMPEFMRTEYPRG